MRNDDPFGNACLSYLEGNRGEEIIVFCSVTEEDVIPVDYLFRPYNEMPGIEQIALSHCSGKVLVVGAGAGCHSIWLQDKGLDVTSIDVSPGAVKTMKQFGLKNVYLQDFYKLDESIKFDTVISLMNGVGIAGDLDSLPMFLNKCSSLVKDNGQILLDSTDLNYLIEEEEVDYNTNADYIGELEYQMSFENSETDWFKWLYIDKEKLKTICESLKLKPEVLLEGGNNNYLIKITK